MHELGKMVNERRKKLHKDRNKKSEKEHEGGRGWVKGKERHERAKECEKDRDQAENLKELEQKRGNQTSKELVTDQEQNKAFGGNHLSFFAVCLAFLVV